jgi:tRNA(fMet)-specific endonuclease VapC
MYLLDTNHCSFAFVQKDEQVIQRIETAQNQVFINTVIYAELIAMVEKSQYKQDNLILLNDFVSKIKIYVIDEETAKIYGKFYAEIFDQFAPKEKAKRRKYDIKEAGVRVHDLWVACTAIQHDLIIVSEDRDFQIMNQVRPLKLECWKSRTIN